MLADKMWRKQKASAELVQLATHVTRNLFARLVPDLIGPGKILAMHKLDLAPAEHQYDDEHQLQTRSCAS